MRRRKNDCDGYEEFRLQKIYYPEQINGMFQSFLISLARYLATEKDKRKSRQNITDLIIQYIHQHYEQPLTNKDIAEVFCFHPNYINRLMMSQTGTSLHQYVLKVKLQKAVEMLHTTAMSVTEIAQALGFCDISHFSRVFKEKMGCNPNDARY